MIKRLTLAGLVLAATVLVVGGLSTIHAQTSASDNSRAPDFSGPCEVSATLDSGGSINPKTSGGVYTVDHEGSASYTGSIAQPSVPRAHSGKVNASTPPLIPSINLKSPWGDDDSSNTSDSGTVSWDIPSWVPGGIKITVSGSHTDGGLVCKGSIVVKLDGNITSGPLGIGSIILTVLAAVGMVWTWAPKR